ncbi:hypothetical protein [Ruminiclostridium cellulolyticum]|uniref:Uncharacterized protein n=1 Tax=Ruminiclostridium cellulolyticum (strain ATCC 35319 / DSM 5812 / JCM 6584 / H10) TaxID=394503 RepID=B8I886_RUMCH|nr:hypothetical protein [Ruminiclostridium cellulolyticum]ACL77186.1 hypothetical protein Ccel_2892 [Ruminiclostridium cellulolyticum H10]
MKKYLSGSWTVLKTYLIAMLIFYIFFPAFYKRLSLFSVFVFVILIVFIYAELHHLAGVNNRRYGSIQYYDGAIYGFLAVVPFAIIQVIISFLDFSIEGVNFPVLRANLIKGLAAPMLFIEKSMNYSVIGYIVAWFTVILISFLGYFAGYKKFDVTGYARKLLGLQPRKPKPKRNRRFF